tara:strand:+ start:217 stop:2286 length:2070 start_codon:yes stop_codon:yes gene_type:complete
MKYYLLIISFFFITVLQSQSSQQFGKIFKKSQNQPPVAKAGEDKKVFPGSTITVSGEKSGDPNGDILQYEWSLPPSLMDKEDYTYDDTDTLKVHAGKNKNSVDVIKTYTSSFLLDISDQLPIGSKYVIKLVVKDKEGLTSSDSFELEIIPPEESNVLSNSDAQNQSNKNKENSKNVENKSSTLISIQSLSLGELVPMQAEAINSIIYNMILGLGMENVIEPNQYRPDSIYTIGKVDSLNPSITLEYDKNCVTDSCAANNALIDRATHVLSWSFNKHRSLSIRFFNAKQYLESSQNYSWSIFSLPFDQRDSIKVMLPKALAVDVNGDLIISSANNHNLMRVGLNQKTEEIVKGNIYNTELINPSGMDVAADGSMYISDRDNNRVFSMNDGKYKMMADRSSSIKLDMPGAIRVLKNGSVVVVCEGDQSVRLINSRGKISTILEPGVLRGITDLAVDNSGNYFVVSPYLNQIFRIDGKNKVSKIAGVKEGTGLKGNGILASQAELYKPISIDFDVSGRMYIAEKENGLIRYIEEDSLLYTVAGGGFDWDGSGIAKALDVKIPEISYIRVGTGPSIYISQMIENSVKVVTVMENPSWIAHDMMMSPMHLIYESGIIGLKPYLSETLPKLLKGYVPKQRIPITKRFKKFNLNLKNYLKERPLLIAVLLLIGSQATSSAFGNAGSLDTPPDFPNI